MRGWWLLFVAGCSFEVPSLGDAEQACIDWYRACLEKAISCGKDQAEIEGTFRAHEAACSEVVWSDSHEVHDVCIPALMAAECGDTAIRCGSFVRL